VRYYAVHGIAMEVVRLSVRMCETLKLLWSYFWLVQQEIQQS